MSDEHPFTHKGWFWFCPIFLALEGEDGAVVEARYAWMEPVFTVCDWLEAARIFLTTAINPGYEPMFAFRITGELRK